MSHSHARFSISLLFAAILTGCSPAPKPDKYPAGTKVTLSMRMVSLEPFQLGPRSSQLFLDMLTNQPVHTQISQMPASPMGTFSVDGAEYLWHGNGVTRGKGRHERIWHGPYLQRLVRDLMSQDSSNRRNRELVQRILDSLEQDPNVAATQVQGPGQYPGGANDASLRPSRFPVKTNNP